MFENENVCRILLGFSSMYCLRNLRDFDASNIANAFFRKDLVVKISQNFQFHVLSLLKF